MSSLKICCPVLLLIACQPPLPPAHPDIVMNQTAIVANDVSEGPPGMMSGDQPAYAPEMRPAIRSIMVVTDRRIPRPSEVVGVLDFHSSATSQDKGFDELRIRAAAIGADAVISAEFEHGGGDEPSHLAGIAVRFLDP